MIPGEWFVFVTKVRVLEDVDKSEKLVGLCKEINNNDHKGEFLRVFDSLDKPSVANRGYYISLFCEDCVDGESWENPKEKIQELEDELDVKISEHYTPIVRILFEEKQVREIIGENY